MLRKSIISVLLVLYFSLFFLQRINLTTADLGRHITNGKIFLQEHFVVSTNHYAYTETDFPVVTHHWLSGVVFYLIEGTLGFSGLSIFYILISGLTVFFFYSIAKRKSNFHIALFLTLLLIPVMANRREIRPEGFSYLFLGVYFYLFELYRDKEITLKKLLFFLIPFQILWVNLHLFFITGIFVAGVYFGAEFIKNLQKKKNNVKEYSFILVALVVASMFNPYFVNGLLEPLNIFKEYGYMIIENQPIFFMQKRAPQSAYLVVEISTLVLLWMLITIYTAKGSQKYFQYVVFSLAFLVLSYKAIRGIPMYVMFAVPLIAMFVNDKLKISTKLVWGCIAIIVLLSLFPSNYFSIAKKGAGLGLYPGINRSAEFFLQNDLHGPIYNNYDIGGYLIFHLYGKEAVFVDNRPEAYSAEFLQNLYLQSHKDPEVWKSLEEQYNFNTIFFYRHDATQYAQPFLIERIQDPTWVPVFVDDYTLILVKDNELNSAVIKEHRLPNNLFIVR